MAAEPALVALAAGAEAAGALDALVTVGGSEVCGPWGGGVEVQLTTTIHESPNRAASRIPRV